MDTQTTETTETIDAIANRIKAKRPRQGFSRQGAGIYRTSRGYTVRTEWPVTESFEDDFGSILCGCPLSGEAHAHYEYHTTDATDAAAAYVSACEARAARSSESGLPTGAEQRV